MALPFLHPGKVPIPAKITSKLTFLLSKHTGKLLVALAFLIILPYLYFDLVNSVKKKASTNPMQYYNSSKVFNESYIPYLEELGIIGEVDYVDLSNPLPSIAFVTAISENHAEEGRALLTRFAKEHPDWRVVVYDMGMSPESRAIFEKACNVPRIISIDLAHFGVADDLFTYRWKPLIIAAALKEFPVVFWVDTSTFINPRIKMSDIIQRIKISEEGPHVYMFGQAGHSTYAVTEKGMYDYLSPQGDIFVDQYQANKQLYVRTKTTYDLVLKWYVLCGLEKSCMAPEGHKLICDFKDKDRYLDRSNCHRYDQSAISIIMAPYLENYLGQWGKQNLWTARGVLATESDLIQVCIFGQ